MPSSAIRPVRWVARSNPIVVRGDQYPVPSDVGVRLQVAVPECHGDLERDKRVLGGLAGPTAVGECDWPGVIEEGVHWLRSAPPILSGPNPPGISPYSGPGFAPIHGPRRNAVPSTAFDTGRPTLPGISASAEPRLISRRIPPQMEEGFAVMAGARWSATLAAMGPDPDIYNIKHGFERLDVVGQRLRNSVDLELCGMRGVPCSRCR